LEGEQVPLSDGLVAEDVLAALSPESLQFSTWSRAQLQIVALRREEPTSAIRP
jgi:hypothetical protein